MEFLVRWRSQKSQKAEDTVEDSDKRGTDPAAPVQRTPDQTSSLLNDTSIAERGDTATTQPRDTAALGSPRSEGKAAADAIPSAFAAPLPQPASLDHEEPASQSQHPGPGQRRLSGDDLRATSGGSRLSGPRRDRSRTGRLDAWKRFTIEHKKILKKRVHADQVRRQARFKRQELRTLLEDWAKSSNYASPLSEQASQPVPPWAAVLSDLEKLEVSVEEGEDELVQAEAAVRETLPTIFDSEPDRTFEVLEDNELYFQVDSSESALSNRNAVPEEEVEEMQLSPQRKRILRKLEEVNELEEQLIEMRDSKQRLQQPERSDLNAEESSFLESYAVHKDEVRDQLRSARADLDAMRSPPQQGPPDEDLEQPRALEVQYPSNASRNDPATVEQWLDET